MPPSLFTWPTRNTAISRLFAICINADVHSLTCTRLPGTDCISDSCIVCIESIITTSGLLSRTPSIIVSQSVHALMYSPSPHTPSLSARSFICLSLSSPEIYSTVLSFARLPHICKSRVDFPMPGSPPSSTREPFTSPPPSTLSSSLIPVLYRVSSLNVSALMLVSGSFPPPDMLLPAE